MCGACRAGTEHGRNYVLCGEIAEAHDHVKGQQTEEHHSLEDLNQTEWSRT